MTTHFAADETRTLCGETWDEYSMSSNPKADCRACQDRHARDTGWSFPLPDKVS